MLPPRWQVLGTPVEHPTSVWKVSVIDLGQRSLLISLSRVKTTPKAAVPCLAAPFLPTARVGCSPWPPQAGLLPTDFGLSVPELPAVTGLRSIRSSLFFNRPGTPHCGQKQSSAGQSPRLPRGGGRRAGPHVETAGPCAGDLSSSGRTWMYSEQY